MARLARLIAELRAAPGARDAAEAIARLGATHDGDRALISETSAGARLEDLPEQSATVVELARDVYARIPTAEGRVHLLELAMRAARDEVRVHVVVRDDQSHLGRLAIDAPRRVLRALGRNTAEPGDRVGLDRFAHCFFDEEALLDELTRAHLTVKDRRGYTFTLRRADSAPSAEKPASFASEMTRVLRTVRDVDRRRTTTSPQDVLGTMRARGESEAQRGPVGRARLRRAIGWVDAVLPGGANCYRRVLLEIALDAGAARETIVFGLDVGSTGHVAFEDREERTFDVAFAIPASRP